VETVDRTRGHHDRRRNDESRFGDDRWPRGHQHATAHEQRHAQQEDCAKPHDPHLLESPTGGGLNLFWFALSLAAAVTQAAQFAVLKGRARDISPVVIVAWTQLVAFLGWVGFFVVTGHEFVRPGRAWPALVASVVLVTAMSGLLARASARGDISVVGPVYALSPIFTVVPDAVLSGTLPTPLGFVGVALAVAGTIGLSRGAASGGTLRGLFRRRDALDALLSAMFLGVLSAVDRWGALALGPPSYLVCSHGGTATANLVLSLLVARRSLRASVSQRNLVTVLSHGVLGFTGTAMQTSALTMAPASYVNAVRRLSGLIAVILGGTLFREAETGRRLMAAALACVGAVCLLLAR
jgi:drug/metabolite transporter (DMT)-like permease